MVGRKKTAGLQRSVKSKSISAFERATEAIISLTEQGQPIDFKTIARAGSVSMAYLYRNEKLKSRIEELRAEQQVRRHALVSKTENDGENEQPDLLSLKTENESLHKANQKLRQQNKQLKAEASLVQALERQIVKLQRENQHLMQKVMLMNVEKSSE